MIVRTTTVLESCMRVARRCRDLGATLAEPLVLASVAIALLVGAPAVVQAQPDSGWIGKRVVQKSRNFSLHIENRVVEGRNPAVNIYRVDRIDGPWLWLKAEGEMLSGWVLTDDVVTVERGLDYFTDQIRANPTDAFAYLLRARLWADKKEFDIALSDYTESIRHDSDDSRSYLGRGLAWSEKHEYDKAITDYNEAIRHHPRYSYAYNNRGNAFLDKFDVNKAIADYDEAIKLDPQNDAPYNNRGNAWCRKLEYAKALADYADAIRINPLEPLAYHNRAWLWATCQDAHYRDAKLAVESATTACRLTDWKDPFKLATLAASYAEGGDFDSAVKWQSKAVELCADEGRKQTYQAWLALFRQKKPYHEGSPLAIASPSAAVVGP